MAVTKEQFESVRRELRALRVRYGNMTQLARVLGVSQSLISQVLSRKVKPGMTLISAMSRVTLKPIDEILGTQSPDLDSRLRELEDENRELRSVNARLVATQRQIQALLVDDAAE